MATEGKEDAPSSNEKVEETLSPAELAKKRGNEAFLAKNYPEAIEHYSEAIKLNPNEAIFYSNRSACYGYLKDWKKAYDDAKLSIQKDPKFIKAYYRMATAQSEMKQWDDAETTITAALLLEPGNEVLGRLLKTIKSKRAAQQQGKAQQQRKPLDESQMKEAMELQESLGAYQRELRSVHAKLSATQREGRMNSVTTSQIEPLDASVNMYRTVGRAFVLTDREQVDAKLNEERSALEKSQKDLEGRQEYLDRRIQDSTNNLKELLKGH